MSLLPALTRDLDEQAHDSRAVAFFDLDRTIIDGYSVLPFMAEGIATGVVRPSRLLQRAQAVLEAGDGGLGTLIEEFLMALQGIEESRLEKLGQRVFEKHLAARIHPEARALIRAHRARGHAVVIVTSALRYQAEPVARALGIADADLLCTEAVVDDSGRLTGKWRLPGCWNEGKRLRARLWLRRNGGNFDASWFYTDSAEDLSLLERVAHPVVVDGDARLRRRACMAGWKSLRFRGRTPDVESVVRTTLAASSVYGSLLAGATTLFFGGSRRDATAAAARTLGETGLTLAGVRLRVRGEQYLAAARGAVVVFNHQSALDALIMARLLKHPFTGVCKAELARDPLVGPLFRASGMVFVERGVNKGMAQLAPALDALAEGRSVVIAPEGTRSYGTLPASFKRGAFHLAARAQVPLVPVVIHNAADVLPRGSLMLRPRVPIEVSVLPPIDSAAWYSGDLRAQADALHARYLEVLGFAPPAGEAPPAVPRVGRPPAAPVRMPMAV